MAEYDKKIIFNFADRLYKKANSIVAVYTLIGVVIGIFVGVSMKNNTAAAAAIAGLILGALGFYIGKEKAFTLKLQAQTALCQVKIEENTKK
jgi:membrane associated rhomboid family serine protease